MSTITHFLWLDLETTGVDQDHDLILEVGVILTPIDLSTEHFAFSSLCSDYALAKFILEGYEDRVVLEMHTENGLLAQMESVRDHLQPPHEIGKTICAFMEDCGAKSHAVMLAGSGVSHFDRRFIAAQMPSLDKYLAYPSLDIGVIRRAASFWAPGWMADDQNHTKPHRALDDARLHLEDARMYRDLMIGAAR